MSDALRVTGLAKSYPGLTALRGVDLTVATGEFFVIVGPSGSGKTTFLMCVAGFLVPDSGTIELASVDVTNVPPHKRNVGVVFQNYALFPHLDVKDNVAYGLKMRGWRAERQKERVRELLKLVRLEGLEHRKPQALSGGQQQRVAVARALAFNPDLLLMDEPLGALDRKLREELQDELRSIHRATGTTVLYVTHDQDEAMALGERVAVMNAGQTIQIDRPEEIYRSPATSFVASFVGQANLLPLSSATLADGRVHIKADGLEARVPAPAGFSLDALDAWQLLLRPEAISVSDNGLVAGTVEDIVFLGDRQLARVRLESGRPLAVRLPGRSTAVTGDRLLLGVDETYVRLVRRES